MISLRDVVTGFGVRDPLAEVWRRSLRGGGGGAAVITGVPPLRYIGDGRPLTDYLISGNAVQDGTPSADASVDAAGCGVRTGNLLNLNRTYSQTFTTDTEKWMNGAATVNNSGGGYAETEILGDKIRVTSKNPGYGASFLIKAFPNTMYTVSFETDKTASGSWGGISDRDINGEVISSSVVYGKSATFTTHSNCAFLNVCFRFPPADGTVTFSKIMLNLGSTALPYEPYGYKLPPTVNGTKYLIYLGQVETTRRVKKLVLTGEETFTNYTFSGTRGVYVSNVLETKYTRDYGMCTHYPVSTSPTPNSLWIGANDTRLYFVGIRDALSVDDANDVKNWVAAQYAAGTPVTVWYLLAEPETAVVNEPLMKIGDYADTISFAQAGVTIPTVNGENVLDVPTTVPPSQITIKGGIRNV